MREAEGVARTRQLLDDAAAGDKVALRFVVDRLEPRSRERYVEILLGNDEERHPRVVFDAVTRALSCKSGVVACKSDRATCFPDGARATAARAPAGATTPFAA